MDIINLKATATYENSTQEATIIVTSYVVNDAYFATKKEEILYDTKQLTKEHTAVSGDYLGKIANTLGVSLAELKVQNNLKSDHVAIGQNFTVTLEEKTEKGKKVTFEQITQASVGDAVYLVVATTALQGTTMSIQVRQGKEKGIGKKDTALTLTQNHTATTQITACVGELADGEAYLNKDYLRNLAVAEVTLAPKEEEDLQQWHDDLEQLTDKKTHFYLHVEADIAATVKYQGKNNDDPQRYGHGEGEWFEVGKSKRAPWMEIAEQEYKKHKGINEDTSPLKERITEYFDSSFATSGQHSDPWCAAFVNWCFEQTDDYKSINKGANSLAFDWGPEGNTKAASRSEYGDGWTDGEECKPFYGAVIVLNYSHVAFIVGKNTKDNKYVYLGGNQGSTIRGHQKISYGTVTIGKEYVIMKPKKYIPDNFALEELIINADGSYSSSR